MREGVAVLFNFDLRHINANVRLSDTPPSLRLRLPFRIFVQAISFNCTCVGSLSTKATSFSVSQRPSWLAEDSPATATPTSALSLQLSLRHMFNKLTHTHSLFACLSLAACVCVCVCALWARMCAYVMARQSKLHCADTRN